MSRIHSRSEMEAFVRSAELGGFSAAARELGLTPSALSKFVKRLETRLGVRLLHRTTRSLSLTPEGARLLHRCRSILDDLDAAENEVTGGGNEPIGRLPMSLGVGFGMYQFLPILPGFLERYPKVQVDLRIEDREADLVKEGIDIAVGLIAVRDPGLDMRKLCDVGRVLCASPRYLQRHGAPRVPDDLENHNCITSVALPSGARWSFAGGRKMIAVRGNVSVNNAEAMVRLALMGKGIIRMNEMVVGESIREGRLVPILHGTHDAGKTPLCAAFPAGRDKVPRVAAMLQYLEEAFRHPPWRHRSGRGKPS